MSDSTDSPTPQEPVDGRVVLQGDTHGNMTAVRRALAIAERSQAEAVIQVGDFGIGWSFLKSYDEDLTETPICRFTDKVSRAATAYGIPVWFIDGNHENFDYLEEIGAFGADEPKEIAPLVTYIPRGTLLNIGLSRVLFVGGAYSVDKPRRAPHVSWWPQEEVTYSDVDRCLSHGEVDVVISHDNCNTGFRAALRLALDDPENAPGLEHLVWKNDQTFPEAARNRHMLELVLEGTKPKAWYHGHYHCAYKTVADGTFFQGLNLECELDSARVLDL